MIKKFFALTLMVALLLSSAAWAEVMPWQSAAYRLVPEDAVLVESDMDDGVYEFEFSSTTALYEVILDALDYAPLHLETKYRNISKAASLTLTEEDARLIAAGLVEATAFEYALSEHEDGGYVWRVFYSAPGELGVLTLQGETGELQNQEVFYVESEIALPADLAIKALTDAKGALTIVDIDLELDDDWGELRYEGEAELNGKHYEFELDALTGDIIEWERD